MKTKGAAENLRNARLCKGESRKFGFLDYKSKSRKATKISPKKQEKGKTI
jgi:hypothetical protein